MSVLEGTDALRRFGAHMTELDEAISSSRIIELKFAYERSKLAYELGTDMIDS